MCWHSPVPPVTYPHTALPPKDDCCHFQKGDPIVFHGTNGIKKRLSRECTPISLKSNQINQSVTSPVVGSGGGLDLSRWLTGGLVLRDTGSGVTGRLLGPCGLAMSHEAGTNRLRVDLFLSHMGFTKMAGADPKEICASSCCPTDLALCTVRPSLPILTEVHPQVLTPYDSSQVTGLLLPLP